MKASPRKSTLDSIAPTLQFAENKMILNFWSDWTFEKFDSMWLKIYPLMFVIFMVGMTSVVLTLAGIFDGKRKLYSIFSVFMLPVGFFRILSYNVDIIKQLLRIYEVWYLLLNLIGGILATCAVYDFDIRCLSVINVFIPIICIIFYDSAIQISSKKKLPFVITGSLGLSLMVIFMALGKISNTAHPLHVFSLTFDATHIVMSCFGNIIFLMLRYVIVCTVYPGTTSILRTNYYYQSTDSTFRVQSINIVTPKYPTMSMPMTTNGSPV